MSTKSKKRIQAFLSVKIDNMFHETQKEATVAIHQYNSSKDGTREFESQTKSALVLVSSLPLREQRVEHFQVGLGSMVPGGQRGTEKTCGPVFRAFLWLQLVARAVFEQ